MISAFVSLSSGVFSPHAIFLEVWSDESIMHLPLNRAFIYRMSLLFFFSLEAICIFNTLLIAERDV